MTDTGLQVQGSNMTVPEKHATVLSEFALQPPAVQSAVYKAAGSVPVTINAWDKLRSAVAEVLEPTDIDVKALVTAFRGVLHTRQGRPDLSDAAFVQTLVLAIQKSSAKNGASEPNIQGVIVNALALNNLVVAQKASRVRYEHAFHMHDASIITDIRPIFDISGSTVEGAVISHVLRIDYASSSEKEIALYLALDEDDLDQLEAVIKRARRKEIALKSITDDSAFKIIGDEK